MDTSRLGDRKLRQIVKLLRERYLWRIQRPTAETEPRIVLVLGAGASVSSGLPLWSSVKLQRSIVEIAEKHFREEKHFLKEAWARLGPSIGLPSPDWERGTHEAREALLERGLLDRLCAVACADLVLRDKVLDELQRWFAPWTTEPEVPASNIAGPPPQLGYELIAHMLKHGFIDHIVTFNFDELLDRAIQNELAPEDYVHITSDHHVSAEFPTKPHVVKVHGTISRRETIRFTADHTGILPTQMATLLDHVFFQAGPSGKKPSVKIISLGYSWKDRDFAHFVFSHQSQISDIVVVGREIADVRSALIIDETPLYGKRVTDDGVARIPFRRDFIAARQLVRGAAPPSIDLILYAVWKQLVDEISPETAVMPAARHLLLSYLFSRGDWVQSAASSPLNVHRRDTRFRAELLLHTMECKGMVNLSVMAANCRLNHYGPDPVKRGTDFLVGTGFLQRGKGADVKETYFAKVAQSRQFVDLFCRTFDCSASVIEPTVTATGGLTFKRRRPKPFLSRELRAVFDGEEVEIVPSRDRRPEWTYTRPQSLATYLELQSKTRQLLSANWTHLLVIAESGAWMAAPQMKAVLARKRKAIVLCIETSIRGLEDWRLRREISAYLRRKRKQLLQSVHGTTRHAELAWWKHNRHLTLAYNYDLNEYLGGIYFRRSLKASQISPVYVDDHGDCAELLVTFLSYAKRVIEDIGEEKAAPAPSAWRRKERDIEEFRKLLKELTEFATRAPIPNAALSAKRDELLDRIEDWLRATADRP